MIKILKKYSARDTIPLQSLRCLKVLNGVCRRALSTIHHHECGKTANPESVGRPDNERDKERGRGGERESQGVFKVKWEHQGGEGRGFVASFLVWQIGYAMSQILEGTKIAV
jgi:hypothetical protein